MSRLTWADMNTLNVVVGGLRTIGLHTCANALVAIQGKATRMIQEAEAKHVYLKTVNVTNHKNVLVQVPAYVVRHWGLSIGDKLEVCYDDQTQQLCIRPDVQGRSSSTEESN